MGVLKNIEVQRPIQAVVGGLMVHVNGCSHWIRLTTS